MLHNQTKADLAENSIVASSHRGREREREKKRDRGDDLNICDEPKRPLNHSENALLKKMNSL
jgi:hypothetical protein